MTDFTTDIYMKVVEGTGKTQTELDFDAALETVFGAEVYDKADVIVSPVTRMCEEWVKIGFKTAFQLMAEQFQNINVKD